MKRKYSVLLLCVCMVMSGLQMDSAHAMEEQEIQTNDMGEENFESNGYQLTFALEKDSEYSWACVTDDLKTCTVEQVEMKMDDEKNQEVVFQVNSVCEGTECIDFSYKNEKGMVKKNLTYKVEVDSEGIIECTRMAYYSDDVKDSIENWDGREQGAIFTFPRESRGASDIQIEDTDIVFYNSDYRCDYLVKEYDCNEAEKEWLEEFTQYFLLHPRKAGSTTMTVTYCREGGPDVADFKLLYRLVVDENLHITVIPMEYIEPENDPTEGIITREYNISSAYCWSYKIADQKIADITEMKCIYYNAYNWDMRESHYYTVKGLSSGTTYIRFIYALNERFEDIEVYDSAWYRVDVDEQRHVIITEIPYAELPGNVDLPQVTSSPAVMASYYPDYSMPPEVTEEPVETPVVSTSPAIESELQRETEPPVLVMETPQISETPVLHTEEPKETDKATQLPKPTENAIVMETPKATVMPETTATTTSSTITPTATVENETISAEVVTKGAITETNVPEVTKQETVKVGTVKITSSIRKSVKKAVVKWKKLAGVKGYQVVLATDKKFTKNVKKRKVSQTKVVLSSLRKGKKYYVKVRAYCFDENGKKVYGQYSDVKVVKKK